MSIFKLIIENNSEDGKKKTEEIYLKNHRYAIRYIINEIYNSIRNDLPVDTKNYFMQIKNKIKLDNKYTFNNINYIIEEIKVYYEDYSDDFIKSLVHESCF
jgi:hypothetical protein